MNEALAMPDLKANNSNAAGKSPWGKEIIVVKVAWVVVLAIAILSGCGKRETDVVGDKGRDAINLAKTQVDRFVIALDRYRQSVGNFPTTRQGLQALRTRPSDMAAPSKWNGPYLNPEVSLHPLDLELPLDPWGHPYHYRLPGVHNPDSFDVLVGWPRWR